MFWKVTYIPSWLPGATFKQVAKRYKKTCNNAFKGEQPSSEYLIVYQKIFGVFSYLHKVTVYKKLCKVHDDVMLKLRNARQVTAQENIPAPNILWQEYLVAHFSKVENQARALLVRNANATLPNIASELVVLQELFRVREMEEANATTEDI